MKDNRKETDVLTLGNELTLRRYLFNKTQVSRVLNEADYILLQIIMETGNEQGIYEGRTYLKELSEKMMLTIRQTSKLIGKLKERGLVEWSHDGDGNEGTYVTITEEGRQMLKQQQTVYKEYYGNVIERFGKDNLIELLNLMKQLETVMYSEQEKREVIFDADGGDE